MDKKPLISIIVPYYNPGDQLKRCVSSLAGQSYRNLEILLINDGSDDGSPDAARSLAASDNRIIPVDIPHSGVSVARNTGLLKASGDLIMFVDSDDWMNTDIVECILKTMQETEADFHPAIITSGDYSYMINDDKTATICEYTGDEDVIEIPSEIDGYPVSEIGYQAFTYKEMSSLTIPDSVRAIGQRAFEYCVISDTLQLPENITIGGDAFSYAELPSAVDIPAGTVVEDCAFSYCDTIKQVFIGSEAVIGSRAFDYCERLGQVVCGQGSRLNERAFEYCDVLGEVVLCGDVEADEESFSYCGDFEVIEAEADEYDTWAQPAEDDVKTGGLSGGWEVSEDEFLTVKARVLFEKAMADYDGAKCEPVTLLATQVVAGTNYCYLCRTDGDGETSPYQLVYIWEDLSGNAQVLEVQNIELGLSAE